METELTGESKHIMFQPRKNNTGEPQRSTLNEWALFCLCSFSVISIILAGVEVYLFFTEIFNFVETRKGLGYGGMIGITEWLGSCIEAMLPFIEGDTPYILAAATLILALLAAPVVLYNFLRQRAED